MFVTTLLRIPKGFIWDYEYIERLCRELVSGQRLRSAERRVVVRDLVSLLALRVISATSFHNQEEHTYLLSLVSRCNVSKNTGSTLAILGEGVAGDRIVGVEI